jgi:hypothetical protein
MRFAQHNITAIANNNIAFTEIDCQILTKELPQIHSRHRRKCIHTPPWWGLHGAYRLSNRVFYVLRTTRQW